MRAPNHHVLLAALVALAGLLLALTPSPPAGGQEAAPALSGVEGVAAAVPLSIHAGGPAPPPPARVEYRVPVAGAVLDPFRAPAGPYGAGNRGVEIDAAAGAVVGAAAPGTVTFAGVVAGARYVTVRHADRLRTTYGPLATAGVHEGDEVAAGAPVGTAAGPILWTARAGDAYVDPAILLAASGRPRVRLVPTPDEPVRSG